MYTTVTSRGKTVEEAGAYGLPGAKKPGPRIPMDQLSAPQQETLNWSWLGLMYSVYCALHPERCAA